MAIQRTQPQQSQANTTATQPQHQQQLIPLAQHATTAQPAHPAHPAQPNQLAHPAQAPGALVLPPGVTIDFGDTPDAPTPWIAIAQGESAERDHTRGMWFNRATGEEKQALTLSTTRLIHQRSLRTDYKAGKAEQLPPACVSLDGAHGRGSAKFDAERAEQIEAGVILANKTFQKGAFAIEAGRPCASCPFSQWTTQAGERTKPACAESFVFVGFESEWGPVVYRAHGMAIKPWKAFQIRWQTGAQRSIRALAASNLQSAVALGPDAAPLSMTFDVGTVDHGKFIVPDFGGLTPTHPEDYAAAAMEIGALQAIRERITTREEEAQGFDDSEGTSATGPGLAYGASAGTVVSDADFEPGV